MSTVTHCLQSSSRWPSVILSSNIVLKLYPFKNCKLRIINKDILFIDDFWLGVRINKKQHIIQSLNHTNQHFEDVLPLVEDKVSVLFEKLWAIPSTNVIDSGFILVQSFHELSHIALILLPLSQHQVKHVPALNKIDVNILWHFRHTLLDALYKKLFFILKNRTDPFEVTIDLQPRRVQQLPRGYFIRQEIRNLNYLTGMLC